MQSEFDINELVREAQVRWLKPAEVYYIIQNCEDRHLRSKSAKKPPSGTFFLYNKRVLRNFRGDGHNWRKKRDGRTVGEAHERLKVDNVEALNCYYAHGEDNPSFRRRSFWMLSGERSHIVLVQYLDVANQSPGSVSQPSFLLSPPASLSPGISSATNQEFVSVGGEYDSNINLPSPVSAEIGFEVGINNNMVEVNQASGRLEKQLSLNNENLNGINSLSSPEGMLNSSNFEGYGMEIANQVWLDSLLDGSDYAACDGGYAGVQNGFNSLLHEAGLFHSDAFIIEYKKFKNKRVLAI